jgi:hypothetical protein
MPVSPSPCRAAQRIMDRISALPEPCYAVI